MVCICARANRRSCTTTSISSGPRSQAQNRSSRAKRKLVIEFKYEGNTPERGKGAKSNDVGKRRPVAMGRIERTIPLQVSLGEGLDIGMDVGSPVEFTYKLPFIHGPNRAGDDRAEVNTRGGVSASPVVAATSSPSRGRSSGRPGRPG